MEIAVCDDQKEILSEVKGVLQEINHVGLVEYYSDIELFMKTVKGGIRYDVILMDINWKTEKNGIDIAAELYDVMPESKIIFITAYAQEYVESVFFKCINVEGYIKKPIRAEVVQKLFEKLENKRKIDDMSKLILKRGKGFVSLLFKEIVYIESIGHDVHIHSLHGETIVYSSLKDVYKKLPENFCHCQKSFIINFDYVSQFEKLFVTMTKGIVIPLSKLKANQVMDQYLRYVGNEIQREAQ